MRKGIRGRSRPLHGKNWLLRARTAFVELLGDAAAEQRAREIAALPTVIFKGERLFTIRCHGETGNGPHDRHMPEAFLWCLIDLQKHRCRYHA